MTTFYLVRHGVTAHTGHKLSGWMRGIHLTDEGRRQAEAVADRLAAVPLVAVYSSPIERCAETARLIAQRQGLSVSMRRSLGEVEYGRWTNRSFKSLRKTRMWEQVQRYPSGVRFPDGETLREVQARALAELDRLAEEQRKGAVCVVTHADVIRLVAAQYLGMHIDLFQRLSIGPASITVIGLGELGPRVFALNVPSDGEVVTR